MNKRKKKQLSKLNNKKINKLNVLFYMAKKHKAYEFKEGNKSFVLMTEDYFNKLQEEKEELTKKIKENLELLT